MILDLSGVRGLITGGTRGIGRGITEALAASGARVAVNYKSNGEAADESPGFWGNAGSNI